MRPVNGGHVFADHIFEAMPRAGVIPEIVKCNPGESVADQLRGGITFCVAQAAERLRNSKRPAKISDIHTVDEQAPYRSQPVLAFPKLVCQGEGFRPDNVRLGQRTSRIRKRCC